MSRGSVTVLTFNVFAGSPHGVQVPWPQLRCAWPPIGLKWAPLFPAAVSALGSSSRLSDQISAILELNPDVVCLQELYCDHCAEQYIKRMGEAGYWAACSGPSTSVAWNGRTVCALVGHATLVISLAAVTWCAGWVLARALLLPLAEGLHVQSATSAGKWLAPIGAAACITFAWHQCRLAAASAWMRGTVPGGVVTFYRRSMFRLKGHCSKLFEHQGGDVLNWFRPRGYNCVCLLLENQRDAKLCIVNGHYNLGLDDSVHREMQVREALNAAIAANGHMVIPRPVPALANVIACGDYNATPGSTSIRLTRDSGLGDAWGDGGRGGGETWCRSNDMTRTFDSPDSRIDFVFFDKATLECSEARVVMCDPPLSDHFGLLARVSWRERPGQ